jgi:hypothetical protein
MSAEQYLVEFLKLSSCAPLLIPDEQTKAERFHDGLSPLILEQIIVLKVIDYAEMVHVSTMAEKGIKEAAANYMNRKQSLSLGPPSPSFPPTPPLKG